MRKCCFFFTFLMGLLATHICHATSVDDIIQKVIAQREKVKDWSALYTQKTMGDGLMSQEMIEMGKITVKGDMVRKDIQRPLRRTIVQSNHLRMEKDLATGEVISTDLSQDVARTGLPRLTPETAFQQISFRLVSENMSVFCLEGQLASVTVRMTIDRNAYVPIAMDMQLPGGATMRMQHQYERVEDMPMLSQLDTTVEMVIGNQPAIMRVHLLYKNIKPNRGISDAFFRL